jgi:glycosyltransferase involved in cell wall biosynthesis
MRLVRLPTVSNKYSDTLVHTLLSSIDAARRSFDIALYFIVGNSPVVWIPRLFGQRAILNVDGLDWKRAKWPEPAKKYIRFAEWIATKSANRIVTDSRVIEKYYQERYGCKSVYIPYGSERTRRPPGDLLKRLQLEPRRYLLFVGRLVPENCAHHLVEAFKSLPGGMKCVVVGDAPYADQYIAQLKALADPRTVFPGYIFGAGYEELLSNAYAFVETSGVGGTHPALVEAMGLGNCVVVHDTPENLETISGAGLAYRGCEGARDLHLVIEKLVQSPELVEAYARRARERAERFSWDAVTDEYERLFEDEIQRRTSTRD